MYSFIPTVIDDESCITIGPTGLRRAVSRLESESGYRYLEIDMKNIWRHKADVYFCLLFLKMSTDKDKSKIFYYRQTQKGKSYTLRDYWKPGDALRETDRELLREVQEFYQKHGYSPRKEDMKPQIVGKLKGRFRIWKNVILAAGLPDLNSAEMQQKRKGAKVSLCPEKNADE